MHTILCCALVSDSNSLIGLELTYSILQIYVWMLPEWSLQVEPSQLFVLYQLPADILRWKGTKREWYTVYGKKKRVTKPTGTVMHWRHRLASHEWCSCIGPYSTNNIQPSPSCKSQMSIECLIYCCLLEHEILVSIILLDVCIHTRYPLKAVPKGAVIWKIAIRLAA
jgi:hypothetical protein